MNALEFELQRVRDRYRWAFESLQEYVSESKDYYKGLKEVVGRLLTSRVLCSAVGGYGELHGYIHWFQDDTDKPLSRMEFISHFVGHELLDDGDPGIGWHRYDLQTGKYEICLESDDPSLLTFEDRMEFGKKGKGRPEPFFFQRKEMLKPEPPLLTPEKVLWVLDWHEKKEEQFYDSVNDIHDILEHPDKKEERPPENPMLVALAKELGYDGNGK